MRRVGASAGQPSRHGAERPCLVLILGVLYLQEVLGYDALETGLAFLPTTLVMGTLSVRYAEPLIMRFGARRTLLPGLLLIALGLALFATVPVDGSYIADVLPPTLLLGLGVGVSFPALMTLALDAGGLGPPPPEKPIDPALVARVRKEMEQG